MTRLPPTPHHTPDTEPMRMGMWERIMGDVAAPDVRILVVTLALALGILTARAAGEFVQSDPVVQQDLAAIFGTTPPQIPEPPVTTPEDVEVMDWPSVEYQP